ncbi:MAG: amidohydrolase family protein [Rhodospirillaceae bacterium]|jgi:D-galactarolactone isomerase|nr:amidohydrolase family protein [Rhodospirillaceae bacterium]MBT4115951.1 amidohydrolase family protein [Rhodospirillaceae bacterium]MBT4673688.1 amidohydrolase family protein [Rhodospirillaceae bacterium]MBT4749091.1 amidohydrolase family protein [Rhodospirillaceae bacterium]MBT5177687.1 amidohydrolase family protein [Rhodospirillaceae bacterium]
MAYLFEGQPGPAIAVPPGATDTHMHIYEPGHAMAPDATIPPLDDARIDDYRILQARLGLERVVVVQPSTYGKDNTCTMEAVAAMGADARAVVVVDALAGDDELAALTKAGARGIRFHMLPGGALPWEVVPELSARAAEHGWHAQLQLDGRDLTDRLGDIAGFAGDLVIDHMGRFFEPVGPDHPGFKALLGLIAKGAWVKLSAPYLTEEDGAPAFQSVGALVKLLVAEAPERMLWASNWPHPGVDPRPDDAIMMDTLGAWIGDDAIIKGILVDNPAQLYGF